MSLSLTGCLCHPPKPDIDICVLDAESGIVSCGKYGRRHTLVEVDHAVVLRAEDWEKLENYRTELEWCSQGKCGGN